MNTSTALHVCTEMIIIQPTLLFCRFVVYVCEIIHVYVYTYILIYSYIEYYILCEWNYKTYQTVNQDGIQGMHKNGVPVLTDRQMQWLAIVQLCKY